MIRVGTVEGGLPLRSLHTLKGNGATGTAWKNYIFLPGDEPPQAYIAEQSPGAVLGAHFHHQNQFQLFIKGSGRIGRHEVEPVTLHYSSLHTAYGPICAGPEGLSYMTLRPSKDAGAMYMPESRNLMNREPKCNLMTDRIPIADDAARAREPSPVVRELIAPRPDGVAAWICRIPPNQPLHAPVHDNSGGRHLVVVGGSMTVSGRELPQFGCVFSTPDEPPVEAMAGATGLEVLVLQYPGPA